MEEQFDAIGWINSNYSCSLDVAELKNVRDFALMWNLFEQVVCDKDYNPNRIKGVIQNKGLKSADFAVFFDYFKNRYVEDGKVNNRFQYLKGSTRNINLSEIEATLTKEEASNDEIIFACITIIFRWRNNLFHGEKPIWYLPTQEENFEVANKLIATFMEKIK